MEAEPKPLQHSQHERSHRKPQPSNEEILVHHNLVFIRPRLCLTITRPRIPPLEPPILRKLPQVGLCHPAQTELERNNSTGPPALRLLRSLLHASHRSKPNRKAQNLRSRKFASPRRHENPATMQRQRQASALEQRKREFSRPPCRAFIGGVTGRGSRIGGTPPEETRRSTT